MYFIFFFATQLGSNLLKDLTSGVGLAIILEKFVFKYSGNPLFIKALIEIILLKPSIVKCSLFLIKPKAFSFNSK